MVEMTIAIGTIRDELVTLLKRELNNELTIYPTPVDTITAPCVVIGKVHPDPDYTMGLGSIARYEFPIRVYVDKTESGDAQVALDKYMLGGALDVYTALMQDNTLAGTVASVTVEAIDDEAVDAIGGVDFLGFELLAKVNA